MAAVSHCDPSRGLKTNAPWQIAADACETARTKVGDPSSSATTSKGEDNARGLSKKANASSSRLLVLPALPDPLAVGIGATTAAATYEASLATQIASRATTSSAATPTAAATDLTWRPAPLAADANSAGAVGGGGAPPPRGLPAQLVNASAIDAPALRAAIADLWQSSPHLQVPPGAGAFWQPADFSGGSGFAAGSDTGAGSGGGRNDQSKTDDDESSLALARKARLRGQVGQVIVVGQGARAAVRAGAGLHVAELVQQRALQEFSCGGAHGGNLGSDDDDEEEEEKVKKGLMKGDDDDEMKEKSAEAAVVMSYTLPWRADRDLKPLEYAESLAEGISKLKPYGVLVLRAQRHDPSIVPQAAATASGAPAGFPTLTAEGCLLLGDDQWGAVLLGAPNSGNSSSSSIIKESGSSNGSGNRTANPEKSYQSSKPNAQQQFAAGGPGGSGVDTLVCAAPGIALCGLVIEAPPPPCQGHAVAVSGGCSSCTLEGCLLRGPTSLLLRAPPHGSGGAADNKNVGTPDSNGNGSMKVVPWSDGQSSGSSSSSGGGGNKAKKRKQQQHGWSGGGGGGASDGKATLRGCCCAADGALLRLLRCHVRGGHGERSRALVAAAAQAAAAKASTSSPFASSSLQYKSGGSGSTGASALVPNSASSSKPNSGSAESSASGVILSGGSGAGLAIGGAGVFVVGKAVADVEDSLIDGCRGPGLEVRRALAQVSI